MREGVISIILGKQIVESVSSGLKIVIVKFECKRVSVVIDQEPLRMSDT